MVNSQPIRVRFAPSPTGMMHLGNVRAALLNFLFAKRKKGTFIIRIEDTDAQRNFDPGATQIIQDLLWLGLDYQEGPIKGGTFEPYFQSQRTHLYQEHFEILKHKGLAYRCFCTPEELEKRRQRQLALKQPPRYDRVCFRLSEEEIAKKLKDGVSHFWRFKVPSEGTITITDMARGPITFDWINFSDFALTRADGSFTFLFANFVDDMIMEISHVIRGEDHLTNTACQAALYQAFKITIPLFWHLPIICNLQGQKLSKRDFGFSLLDLKNAGFLSEAICNYLATIGGGSFEKEIMNLDELAQAYPFDDMKSTGAIKYDVEKLRWFNHKWIEKAPDAELATQIKPIVESTFGTKIDERELERLIGYIKTDLITLQDSLSSLEFYFKHPAITTKQLQEHIPATDISKIQDIIQKNISLLKTPETFVDRLKERCKAEQIPLKNMFTFVRMALSGQEKGPALAVLVNMLGHDVSLTRLKAVIA